MSLTILGLGTALPNYCISQSEAAKLAVQICCETDEQAALLPVIYRQAGIDQRHLAVPHSLAIELADGEAKSRPDESNGHARRGPGTEYRMGLYRKWAKPLAEHAARLALEASGLAAGDITHLVTVSCTGFAAPGVDIDLMKKLQLSQTVQRIHVGFMGCHGAINGLRVAQALCDADRRARVLLCAVELCSIHYHFGWDPKRVVANALFADGAAALVGMQGTAHQGAWQVAATGSCLFPQSEHVMTWQIGDHGFEMTLAARVPGLIADHLRPWLEAWLAEHGVTMEQVLSWAIHPGGPRILSAVEQALGLGEQDTAVSREVLANCGNMSSPTLLFILERLRLGDRARPCVLLGFGPGLIAESALVV